MTSKDAKYDQNDFLAFVASVDSMHDSHCESDSECEYTDEQNVAFLDNLVVEYQNLIKTYLRNNDIIDARKAKIDLHNEERTNFLENFLFLEKKIDLLSLNIIFFSREIMFSLKRL